MFVTDCSTHFRLGVAGDASHDDSHQPANPQQEDKHYG